MSRLEDNNIALAQKLISSFKQMDNGLTGALSALNGLASGMSEGLTKEEAEQAKKDFDNGNIPDFVKELNTRAKNLRDKYGRIVG
jgi:hypothetical protein